MLNGTGGQHACHDADCGDEGGAAGMRCLLLLCGAIPAVVCSSEEYDISRSEVTHDYFVKAPNPAD